MCLRVRTRRRRIKRCSVAKRPRFLLVLNGWPGVGKSTIGVALATSTGARFLPNHLICAPASAVAAIGSAGWSRVRDRTLEAIWAEIGSNGQTSGYVATNVVTQGPGGSRQVDGWRKAAERVGLSFTWVTLVCDREENLRRLGAPGRQERGSLVAPRVLKEMRELEALFEPPPDIHHLRLDVTRLPVDQLVMTLRSSV